MAVAPRSRWRISRAALLGFGAGLLFKAAGFIPPITEPPGVVFHWAHLTGEWAATGMIVAVMFSIVAVVRNLIFVRAP